MGVVCALIINKLCWQSMGLEWNTTRRESWKVRRSTTVAWIVVTWIVSWCHISQCAAKHVLYGSRSTRCARVWSICSKLKINTWYGEAALQLPGLVGILCVPYMVLSAVEQATSKIDEHRATCDVASSVCKFVCSWLQFLLELLWLCFNSTTNALHFAEVFFFFHFFDWLHAPDYKWSSGTVLTIRMEFVSHQFLHHTPSWNYQKSPLWLFGC